MKAVTAFLVLCSLIMYASAEESNKWKKPEGEPLFVAISRTDEAMLRAYEKARTTFPRFLAAITTSRFAAATNAAKIKIRDDEHSIRMGEDRFVYLWVYDVKEIDGGLSASVRELPQEGINSLTVGSTVDFKREEVYDWMIIEDGRAWGAFTIRVVRDRMGEKERSQFEDYSGIRSYEEEEP